MSFPAAAAARVRVLVNRLLSSIGFRDDAFLLLVAAAVGVVTAIAAVGFHELIVWIAENLYRRIDPELLCERAPLDFGVVHQRNILLDLRLPASQRFSSACASFKRVALIFSTSG